MSGARVGGTVQLILYVVVEQFEEEDGQINGLNLEDYH